MEINDKLLDELLAQAGTNERRRINLDLRNGEGDTSQRMLNALLPGTHVPIHRHTKTIETVILLRGHITELFYDEKSVPAVPAITTAPDKLIIPATPIVKQTQCHISPTNHISFMLI